MKYIVTILSAAVLLITSSFERTHAEVPEIAPATPQITTLERVYSPDDKAPRTLPLLDIISCYYTAEFIAIDLPEGFSTYKVQLWNSDTLMGEYTISSTFNFVCLQATYHFDRIICIIDENKRYEGIANFNY